MTAIATAADAVRRTTATTAAAERKGQATHGRCTESCQYTRVPMGVRSEQKENSTSSAAAQHCSNSLGVIPVPGSQLAVRQFS